MLQPLMDAAAQNVHLACPEIHRALKSVEVDVTGRKIQYVGQITERVYRTLTQPIMHLVLLLCHSRKVCLVVYQ